MGITMEVYRLQGDAVLPYLKELRKKQMEEYQEGFAEIDKELGRTSSVNIHDNTPISPAQSYKSTSPEKRPRKKKDASKQDIYAEDEYTRSPLKNNKQQDDLDIDTSPQQHEHEEEQQHDDDEEVDELAEETFDEPFTCQFCGRHDPSFTDMKLDVHYWRECPMLCGCPRCEQIIEVSTLNDHLLNECTKKTIIKCVQDVVKLLQLDITNYTSNETIVLNVNQKMKPIVVLYVIKTFHQVKMDGNSIYSPVKDVQKTKEPKQYNK